MRLEELIEREYQAVATQERYVPDFIESYEGDAGEIKAFYDYIDSSEKAMFEKGFRRGIERQCGMRKTLATEVIRTVNNRKKFWFAAFVAALAVLIFEKSRYIMKKNKVKIRD